MKGTFWTQEEIDEVEEYFGNTKSLFTLYKNINEINPDRTFEAVARKVRAMKEKGYEKNTQKLLKKLRVGYLDIEATGLVGNFAYMLSWYIKKEGKNEYDYAVITKKEIFDYEFDKRLVKELLKALDNYDVIYTHYGSDRRFDVPFIRTRAYAHGLQDMLPDNMEKFLLDTYPIARNKLKLNRNRLDTIAEAVGVTSVKKTPLSGRRWVLASVGCPDSLKYIALHNKRDVQILELVHKKLKKIERPIYKSM